MVQHFSCELSHDCMPHRLYTHYLVCTWVAVYDACMYDGPAQPASQSHSCIAFVATLLFSFKMVWTVQKDAFFRRWRAQDPRVADFDQSITQYTELSNKVQGCL